MKKSFKKNLINKTLAEYLTRKNELTNPNECNNLWENETDFDVLEQN